MANNWQPEVVLPSGKYGVKREASNLGPVVVVVELFQGSWRGTPGQWRAVHIQHGFTPLAIDSGADWVLNPADTYVIREFARQVLAEAGN